MTTLWPAHGRTGQAVVRRAPGRRCVMLKGRTVPGVNYGAYFCPGAAVIVADPFGTWTGQILNMGERPAEEAVVSVTDPGTNPHRHVGERLNRAVSELRLVVRPR